MDALGITFTVIAIIAVILVVLYFVGKHLSKKQEESQKIIDQNRQKIYDAWIIDKKKAKVTEANFPKAAIDQMPKRLKLFKMPLVKFKTGARIVTFFCDKDVFEALPVNKKVTLEVSGGYILGFTTGKKGEKTPTYEKKLTWRQKLAKKMTEWQQKANEPADK